LGLSRYSGRTIPAFKIEIPLCEFENRPSFLMSIYRIPDFETDPDIGMSIATL
jgi:hypothetical protein